MPTLFVAGHEDKGAPVQASEEYAAAMPNARLQVLENVGHWHVFEDLEGVARALKEFL